MTRTRPAYLVLAALLGVGAGFLLDEALRAMGRPSFLPAVSLPILLLLLGALDIVLAIPVYRASRGRSLAPVNPFRALRIAVLAKASSLVGAVVGGFGLGLAVFHFTRPIVPSLGSIGTVLATALCGALLVAAGLVAEQLCTLRKDDDDDQPGDPGADSAH